LPVPLEAEILRAIPHEQQHDREHDGRDGGDQQAGGAPPALI